MTQKKTKTFNILVFLSQLIATAFSRICFYIKFDLCEDLHTYSILELWQDLPVSWICGYFEFWFLKCGFRVFNKNLIFVIFCYFVYLLVRHTFVCWVCSLSASEPKLFLDRSIATLYRGLLVFAGLVTWGNYTLKTCLDI